MTVLSDTIAHGAGKVFEAVSADTGFAVGGNVGGVNPSDGRHHRKPTSEFFAAGSRVAGDTIRRPSQIATAFQC